MNMPTPETVTDAFIISYSVIIIFIVETIVDIIYPKFRAYSYIIV